jgi:hypothetical protein
MKVEVAELQRIDARLAAGEIPVEAIPLLRAALAHVMECPWGQGKASKNTERRRPRRRKEPKTPSKGHGRNGAEDYPGAERVKVDHPDLQPGSPCPGPGCRGRLYDTKVPARHVTLKGAAPISAAIHECQTLRCSTCLGSFTAPLPAGVEPEKYHASVGPVVAMARYEQGMPHHRLEKWQAAVGIPLPASTQFELVEMVATAVLAVYILLRCLAASRRLHHSDDTGARILSLTEENRTRGPDERTGVRTTTMVSLGIDDNAEPIVLYASGRPHAGENLDDLLALRAPSCPECLHMADASSMQPRAAGRTELRCMVHARRRFIELEEIFPEHCGRVLDDIGAIYRHDADAKAENLNAEDRLTFHQTHSAPILQRLRAWIDDQFDQRLVEPNSRLGKAFRYLKRHWSGLTRFLEIPGAPLDNNVAERALKPALRHRKNSLFYRNQLGAMVGDVLMSVIRTCLANGVDPVRYLTAVGQNVAAVRSAPAQWLPWNYPKAAAVN